MNKKGFTLIELMVVVVIIGILAAVAVPKLFGMIAKSKASEVGPAAGTYVKLQQAFVSEKGDAIGSWYAIGYSAPGDVVTKPSATVAGQYKTANFTYTGSVINGNTDGTSPLASTADTWNAGNIAKLNDCGAGATNWKLSLVANATTPGEVSFTSTMATNCDVLTPSFVNIAPAPSAPPAATP